MQARTVIMAVAAITLALVTSGHAATYTVLYSFAGPSRPFGPAGGFIQSGNLLYSTSQFGGYGVGTIFAFNTSNNATKILYSFLGGTSDGANPVGTPIMSGSMLYGMTQYGGSGNYGNGYGTIFAFNTTTNTETVLHLFSGSDGVEPHGSLVQSGNMLYGMTTLSSTSDGGTTGGGTLFSLNTTTNAFNVIRSGWTGYGSLIQSGSILYGMTRSGGSGHGTIFSLDTNTNAVSVLYAFAGGTSDGRTPMGSLVQSGNLLYGMTQYGGSSNNGIIFSLNTTTNTETVLHSFTGGDGSKPRGSLIQSGNMLYGTTGYGGGGNVGTIFSFNTTTNTETVLYSFSGSGYDGHPNGDLLLSGNKLYGMTTGEIFSLTIPEPASASLLTLAGLGVLLRRRRLRR